MNDDAPTLDDLIQAQKEVNRLYLKGIIGTDAYRESCKNIAELSAALMKHEEPPS